MGLLDQFTGLSDDQSQGLLSFGSNLLQNSGPSLQPRSFGQILGSGIGAAQAGAAASKKQRMEDEELGQKLRLQKLQEQRAQQSFDMQKQAFDSFNGGGQPQAPMGGIDGGAAMPDTAQGFTPPNDIAQRGQPQGGQPATSEAGKLRQLELMALAGVPGAKELFDIHKYRNDPLKMEAGATYRDRMTGAERTIPNLDKGMAMNGGTVTALPGYADANAGIQGAATAAQEAAKARYNTTTINTPDGPRMVSNADLPGMLSGGGQPPQPMRAPGAGGTPPAWQAINAGSQSGQPARDDQRLAILQQELASTTNPTDRASITREIASISGQRPSQARQPGLALQSPAQAKEQVGAVDIRQGAATKLNDNWIAQSLNPVRLNGEAAQDTIGQLATLRQINAATGWGTEAKANAANVLTALGVGGKNAELFATNAQKFQSVALNALATDLRKNPGPQTEGDASRSAATYAQLKNTPAANAYIVDLAQAKANRDIRRAQYYQEALPLAQAKGDLTEIDRRWSKIQGSIWDDPILSKYKGQ